MKGSSQNKCRQYDIDHDDLTARNFENIGQLDSPEPGSRCHYCKMICSDFIKCMLERFDELNIKEDSDFWRNYEKSKVDLLIKLSYNEMNVDIYRKELDKLKNQKMLYLRKKKN